MSPPKSLKFGYVTPFLYHQCKTFKSLCHLFYVTRGWHKKSGWHKKKKTMPQTHNKTKCRTVHRGDWKLKPITQVNGIHSTKGPLVEAPKENSPFGNNVDWARHINCKPSYFTWTPPRILIFSQTIGECVLNTDFR